MNFRNLKLSAAEVDEQSVLDPGCAQVTQNLGDMLIRQRFACLDLDYQPAVDEKIGKVVAKMVPSSSQAPAADAVEAQSLSSLRSRCNRPFS